MKNENNNSNNKITTLKTLLMLSIMMLMTSSILTNITPAEAAEQIDFDVVYTGDVLPEDSGFFSFPGGQTGCILRQITPDDTFHMISATSGTCSNHALGWNPDSAVGFTAEYKVKVNSYVGSTGLGGIAMWLGDKNSEAILLLTTNSIRQFGDGKSYSMNTTDDFHIYRITVQNSVS